MEKDNKLIEVLEKYSNKETKNRMIVFVMRKVEAHDVEDFLWSKGYKVRSIHGDKTQWEREKALGEFKAGRINVLVATGEIHIFNILILGSVLYLCLLLRD